MNEIAVEKIVDLIHKNNLIHSLLSIPSRHLARKILRELEELGYRKLPQDKPPIISIGWAGE